MNDVLMAAGTGKAVRCDEVLDTLQAICSHNRRGSQVTAG